MPRRKQEQPKRMKYSEDGKEEGEEKDAGSGGEEEEEEEEDDDVQEEGDTAGSGDEPGEEMAAAKSTSSPPPPGKDLEESQHSVHSPAGAGVGAPAAAATAAAPAAAATAMITSPSEQVASMSDDPPQSPQPQKDNITPAGGGSAADRAAADASRGSAANSSPPPVSSGVVPAAASAALLLTSPRRQQQTPPVAAAPPTPKPPVTPKPSLSAVLSDKPTPLLPDEPLEELAERPLSSLENMSKAIEQEIPAVFEKYGKSPLLHKDIHANKMSFSKPAKVIKEMHHGRSSHHHHHSSSSSSSSHSKSKDRSSSHKGQIVPPSMTRHAPATTARAYSAAVNHTPSAGKVYVDTDQPLDLSKKPQSASDSPQKALDNSKLHTSKAQQYQYTPLPPSTSTDTRNPGSSLSNLEKRFGGNSFLFDGTSGKLNAPKNPLYQAFGGNLFATALYNTPPLASTDQVYRPHYRNYWPGPIPAPRQAKQTAAAAATSVASNAKSHQHESSKGSSAEHGGARKEEQSHSSAGNSTVVSGSNTVCSGGGGSGGGGGGTAAGVGGPGPNGKYTNLICNCKKQFETLYELTIHMQNTSHTPLPCKNGDQGEYPKLVRGQDMWLNQGMEQTRQILRCMQCGESFKSLPELTIHMMKTRHYTNIVGAESRKIHKYTSYYSDNEEEDRGSVFCCKVCHESFKDMDGLANHMVVSGHHKKHVLKTSGGNSSSGGSSASSAAPSSTPIQNHDSKSQSPKPAAGIPVAPTKMSHSSHRSTKSPSATVATLLESQRSLTNGTKPADKTGSARDSHTPDRKRKHSSDSSSSYVLPNDWKSKLIKTEQKDESLSVSKGENDKNGEFCNNKETRDYTVKSSALKNCTSESRVDGSSESLIKSETRDSNDADDDDSMKGDTPELNKIRCENCGERIETPNFVEHVRACVKLTPEEARSPGRESWEGSADQAINLRRQSETPAKLDKDLDRPHPLEYIPYKKRGRYEEAFLKAREREERANSSENKDKSSLVFDNENTPADLSKVKEERSSSPFDLSISRLCYPERPKSQDVNLHRSHDLDRPRSQDSVRSASSEPVRPTNKLEGLVFSRDYPPRPRSNEEPTRSKSINTNSRPSSSDAVLHSRPYESMKLDLVLPKKRPASRDTSSPKSPPDLRDSRPRSRDDRHMRSPSLKASRPKSPLLHSTTDSAIPPEMASSEGSALKAMENFIERSFFTNSNKSSFYRSNPLNGRMGSLVSGLGNRMECPLPDSTAQHSGVDHYSVQHKYLPPSLPTNLKVDKSSDSQKDLRHSPKVKVESGDSAGIEGSAKSNGRSDEADSSDTDAREANDSSPKPLHQKYLADGGNPTEAEKSASALQSLQGLVYGKSFSTEHPLDSLQKLIHNTDTPGTCIATRPNGSQQTYVTGMATLQQQGLPSTVILVNPIVTVMPTTSSASSAVHINISRDSSPPTTAEQCSPTSSSTPSKNSPVGEVDNDQAGDFRCQACNRTFASKGSYRYHLSRCHLSSVKRYGIKEAFNMSPYVYLPLDHTAKFNKYYEMANELANKGK